MSLPYFAMAVGLIIAPDGCASWLMKAEKGVFSVMRAV